jgi:hypothetical protein
VAYSWTRPKPQPDVKVPRAMRPHNAWESAANWVAWNMLTEKLADTWFAGRYLRVRYEDFVAGPRRTAESLLDFTGTRWTLGPFQGAATVRLPTNHTVSGNPSRFRTGQVDLHADDAWRTGQSWSPRRVSTAISLPLLRRYGNPLAA